MRRLVALVSLLLFSIPFGVSISGCSKKAAPVFCNGGDSGIAVGQATTISLTPIVYGISLNFAEIGQVNTPSATDCKGQSASVRGYTYGTTDMTIADVQPNTGQLCGGTWNRNTGGGIPDFTVCMPTHKTGTAYISASADGVTSNPLPIFVHPVVTSIVLAGGASACAKDPNGNFIDPTTACCPLTTVGSPTAEPYLGDRCVSQGTTRQLVARIFAGDPNIPANNISCQAGHLRFSAQGAQGSATSVVSIDPNGVATAIQPGSVLISANIADAASSAGFFSTCPPASITLSAPGANNGTVVINQNNTQPLTATAVDTLGVSLTGLSLEYVSTSPTTIPADAGGSVTPSLAGAASISAICQPPNCNAAPYNQIGLFGNGKPVTSNSVDIVAPGKNSTVLYMASTQSQYLVSKDFTQTSAAAPILLPFIPNSMIISNDGASIYLGSSKGLMVLTAVSTVNISRTDVSQPGTVLAVSPDGREIVISDPAKQHTTLETSSGGIISTYGGVGTRAEFAPDSQTVYIAAGPQLLVYSAYTGWTNITPTTPDNPLGTLAVTDVAITVPSVGAYFAGPTTTARGYCPSSTPTTVAGVAGETNIFYPTAYSAPVTTDRIAATNDGLHILGATATTFPPTLRDFVVQVPIPSQRVPVPAGSGFSIACPLDGSALTFSSTPFTPIPISLGPITATAITGVLPTSDSKIAFITYDGSGGVLPVYAPNTPGTANYTKLSNGATAPIAGVLSADNSTFFVGTLGDNRVHLITPSATPGIWTDTSTIDPHLTAPADPTVTVRVDLLVQKPRKTT